MRHRNRILILDADVIGELEVAIRLEQTGMRKLFFIVMKHLMNFTLQFLITITPLSFVVGDSLYKRYSRFGNVKKIYASWISNENIISPNDLRTKIAATLNRSDLKLVFAGRLAHKKGPHIAIKVAAILAKKGIPITLDLYGSGPMQLELIALIESGGLADIVTRKGYINYDVFLHVLTGYDILLLPNLSGEQPRVLFDAMATGVLVVASDIVSLSDIIRSNYNGILCTPQNPDSFAAVIEHLFSNKKELEPLLYQGMLTARQNTIQSMHEKRKSVIRATFHGERSAAIDYE